MKLCFDTVVIGGSILFTMVSSAWSASAPSDFACEVLAVTCGSASTLKTELEGCWVTELASVGKVPEKTYMKVTFFAGIKVKGDIIVVGSGAKSGMVITCKVPPDSETGKPDYGKLRKELPALLKARPDLKERIQKFEPQLQQVKKIELDSKIEFKDLDEAKRKELKELPEYRSHPWVER